MRYLTILVAVCFSAYSYGQSETKTKSFKIYLNTIYTEHDLEFIDIDESKQLDFGIVSLALEINPGKHLRHEFELMPISVSVRDWKSIDHSSGFPHITAGSKTRIINSSFRYQVSTTLNDTRAVRPYIGLSSQLFYQHIMDEPAVSNRFAFKNHEIGLRIAMIPGINFRLSERISLDLNAVLNAFDLKATFAKIDNPAIPVADQKTEEVSYVGLPSQYNLRIGVSYVL